MSTGNELTPVERRVIAAVENGHRTTRAIARAAGFASNSNAQRYIHNLAAAGHLIIRTTPNGTEVDTGLLDYARGWDACAAMMGNEEA